MSTTKRKTKRNTSLRRRFQSLSANEQVMLHNLKININRTFIHQFTAETPDNLIEASQITEILIVRYVDFIIDHHGKLDRPVRKEWTIDGLDETFCNEFLAFQKADMSRVYKLMHFDNKVHLVNGSIMSGEEVFIRGLYELVTGEKKTSVANTFGRHYTDQCRAFDYFINHVYESFHHLIDNNLEWWFSSGLVEISAKLIESKMNLESNVPNYFAFFIDCNCMETSRPGGGPTEAGANAVRWDPEIQRAYYNGWKSIHGLKHQTVDSSLGLTVDIYGPTSLRRNDITLLRSSNINERVKEACVAAVLQYDYYVFGDSAYKVDSHVRSFLISDTQDNISWNAGMKRVRISIEWNYMATASCFRYVGNINKLRLLQSTTISRVYITATILRNFRTCIYGNETSHYFNYQFAVDFLEKYIYQI
jgi:hypothetical protein